MTGANAPQPPAGTTTGTPSRVPVFGSRTIGTSVTPSTPMFGQVAPDVAPPLPAMPMTTASAAPGLFETKNFGVESVAPIARPTAPAAPAAPAAPVPPTVEMLEPEEVPSVEPRMDKATLKARLDAMRSIRAQKEAEKKAALEAGIFAKSPPQ